MRIFESQKPFESKVNFADENNVLLGYDNHQSCCEDADWFLSEAVPGDVDEGRIDPPSDLCDYSFDTSFHVAQTPPSVDAGGMDTFRLVADGGRELFLTLYNCHNGYYGHGFEMKCGEHNLYSGIL